MNYNPGSMDITVWEALEPGIIPMLLAIIFFIIVPIVILYLIKRHKNIKLE